MIVVISINPIIPTVRISAIERSVKVNKKSSTISLSLSTTVGVPSDEFVFMKIFLIAVIQRILQ